jgi:hypothetical protein
MRQTFALVLLSIVLVGCRGGDAAPSPGAAPRDVLQAYLGRLVSNECAKARRLTTATFQVGNGELCGVVRVTSASIDPIAARPSADEVVFSTRIVASGGGVSLPDGEHVWFYTLRRQPDGEWRIAGGGSGP